MGVCLDHLQKVVAIQPEHREWVYKSPYDLLLKHGKQMEKGRWDSHEKRALELLSRRKVFMPGLCFYNAHRIVHAARKNRFINHYGIQVSYCEGLGNFVIPTDHAWVTVNGKVWDPTWDTLLDGPEMQTYAEGLDYYGVVIPDEFLRYNDGRRLRREAYKEAGSRLFDWQNGYPLVQKLWKE